MRRRRRKRREGGEGGGEGMKNKAEWKSERWRRRKRETDQQRILFNYDWEDRNDLFL